jgi:hypothetical protein
MECTQKANLKNCNCTYTCQRKGKCCECIVYHRRNGELPACYFDAKDEATYNRSIDFFIRSRSR